MSVPTASTWFGHQGHAAQHKELKASANHSGQMHYFDGWGWGGGRGGGAVKHNILTENIIWERGDGVMRSTYSRQDCRLCLQPNHIS